MYASMACFILTGCRRERVTTIALAFPPILWAVGAVGKSGDKRVASTHVSARSEHNGIMRQKPSVTTVHIVEGQPWKEALISVLEPRSPYRPWRPATNIEPGDAVIAVLDTDPESVLAGVGIVGPDGDVGDAFATIDPFYLNGLLELGTLNMLADFEVSRGGGTVYHHGSLDDVVAAFADYTPSTVDALFGHTSLAAGRVLLESKGKCTGCGRQLDLMREDARDRVHIHTADPRATRAEEPEPQRDVDPSSEVATVTNFDDNIFGPRYPMSFPADWPVTLCDACYHRMRRGGFTSFLDFRFGLNPRCPRCSAQRSMSTMYGMPAGPVEEPWIAAQGCCVEPWQWLCGECGHEW